MQRLRAEIRKVCNEMFLVYGDNEELGVAWVEKVRFIIAKEVLQNKVNYALLYFGKLVARSSIVFSF